MTDRDDDLSSRVDALQVHMVELHRRLQADLWNDHQRRVSLGDLLQDRWERARRYGFGEGSSCYDNVLVLGEVRVGENVWIGPNTVLDGSGGLSIGDYCAISAGAQIYSHNSVAWSTSLGQTAISRAPTRIGNGVYVGPGAIIEMGVTVGDSAVIGALTLVNRDVPAGSRFYGIPGMAQGPRGPG